MATIKVFQLFIPLFYINSTTAGYTTKYFSPPFPSHFHFSLKCILPSGTFQNDFSDFVQVGHALVYLLDMFED